MTSQGKRCEDRFIKENIIPLGHRVLGFDNTKPDTRGGWPDIISVIGDEVHVWEIKSGKHPFDAHQLEVISALRRLGAIVHFIRYPDPDGEPEEVMMKGD